MKNLPHLDGGDFFVAYSDNAICDFSKIRSGYFCGTVREYPPQRPNIGSDGFGTA